MEIWIVFSDGEPDLACYSEKEAKAHAKDLRESFESVTKIKHFPDMETALAWERKKGYSVL